MSSGEHWIKTRIAKARERHASLTDGASDRLSQLLMGQLSERQNSASELTSIARALIADMAPAAPKKGAAKE